MPSLLLILLLLTQPVTTGAIPTGHDLSSGAGIEGTTPWWTTVGVRLVLASFATATALGILWLLLQQRAKPQTYGIEDGLHLETGLEERYRDLIENATDLVFTADVHGVLLAANKAAQQTFGISADEVNASEMQRFVAPEDRPVFKDVLALLIGGERTVLRHLRIKAGDGRICVIEMNCRVRHLDGSPSFVEIIGRDVTQQKREQAALEDARAAAEAASRAKSEFLANISHEIRTPMNGILGMTELTLQGTLQRDQRSNLEVVRTSAEALVTIINDILDFSKMEVGRMELDHAPFEIMPLVGSCLDLVALPAARKGLELVCDVDPALPAEWVGDAPRLRQVLVNLVGNASKFTEAGEIVVRVDRIEGCDGRIRARFLVKDTGIGIPLEHHQRIFEMFSQADGSFSRKYGGTGLGLAIASRLVAAMGGRLTVESAPGEGSAFEFTIDVEPGNDHTVALPNTYFGKTAAVLVRNKTLREAILRVLRHAGIETVEEQRASVVITREPSADENAAVVYVRPSGDQPPEYPKDAIVLRPPFTAQAMLTAVGSATSNGASILALQRGSEFVAMEDLTCLSTTDQHPLSGTVLLAEDNKVNQLLAIRTLEKGGYRVVVANNGREAVELMHKVRADVILMDIQMPEMDGFQATAQIREWSSVPVIAMTAHALKGDRERCLTGGMTDYIPKPVRPAALLQMVERYMPTNNKAA